MAARGPLALLALLVLLGAGAGWTAAPPAGGATREVTLTVTRLPDGALAYNGQVPGPTLDVDAGDLLLVRLVNRIDAPVSLHAHGMALAVEDDGMPAHEGTRIPDSSAPPGGEVTYALHAAFPGAWHYHDHVLGHDGAEGVAAGLYGALLVRAPGETRPDAVLDLHLLDEGPNGGRGLTATLPGVRSFDLALVGMGDRVWDVTLRGPDGATLGQATLAPGVSERIRVEDAAPGAYAWTAVMRGAPLRHAGTVVVE